MPSNEGAGAMIRDRYGAARVVLQAACVFSISIAGGATHAQTANGGGGPGPTPPAPETGVAGLPHPGCPQIAKVCALIAEPAVRDYVGFAEYAWDFNAADGVSGSKAVRPSTSELRLARSGAR